MNGIGPTIKFVKRRLRVERGVRYAFWMLLIVVPLTALGLVALALWPIFFFQYWMLIPSVALPAAAFVFGVLWRSPTEMEAVIAIDTRLELREQTSTAYACSDPKFAKDIPPDIAAGLLQQAERRLAKVESRDLRRVFPLDFVGWVGVLVVAFVLALVLRQFIPPIFQVPVQAQSDPAQQAQDAQQTRESARKLAEQAKELEKAAETRKLEALQRAAQEAKKQAEEMAQNPPSKREAMVKMAKIEEAVRKEREKLLGRQDDKGGGNQKAEDQLAELAGELEGLDAGGLAEDVAAFNRELQKEAAAARAEGRAPHVDSRKLEELQDRAKRAEEALKKIEDELRDNPGLQDKMKKQTARQRELLKKIQDKYKKLEDEYKKKNQDSGKDGKNGKDGKDGKDGQQDELTPEDLEDAAQDDEELSEKELEEILEQLEQVESLEVLEESLESAREDMGGG